MTKFLKYGTKLLRQGLKYLKAWLRWRWCGSPRRSPAEVRKIFFEHCEPCGYHDPFEGECILCECSVSPFSENPVGGEVRNKIIYKTEHCPEVFW